MKISKVIGWLSSYEDDVTNGIFNPVEYLGLAKISGFTTVREKTEKEPLLIDRRGCYKYDNDLSYGRKPNAVGHLTGDYEFYSTYRVRLVGYLTPKNRSIPIGNEQNIKGHIIDNCLSDGITGADNIKLIKFERNYKKDDIFRFMDTEDTSKWFAEFAMITADRLHEINRCSGLIGQSEVLPYDPDAPKNAIYVIVATSDCMSRKVEMVEDTWEMICKMFTSDFNIHRFAECDVGFYSN